jgi:hypothetical protein
MIFWITHHVMHTQIMWCHIKNFINVPANTRFSTVYTTCIHLNFYIVYHMLILNSILYSYIHVHICARTYIERRNSVYPANNFLVMQRETGGGGSERERQKNSEMLNSTPNCLSQSPEKAVSQEWIQAKWNTNSQITQSRTRALLHPFLQHCSFSLIIYLFQFEIPSCQFVSSPGRAWRSLSAFPYLSIRVSYDGHIALFIYILFRSFVPSPYQSLMSFCPAGTPQTPYFSVGSFST